MENDVTTQPIGLSERLLRVAAWVPSGARLVDVGTDHALLPIYLAQTGRIACAIASDLRRGPYQAALRNIRRHEVEDRVTARLGDGLQTVSPGEVDTVVIAGMGGDTAARIVLEAPAVMAKVRRIVIQPMNGAHHVRKYLFDHGFHLVYEDVFTADNRDYMLVAADGPANGVTGSDAAYRPYADDPGWLDLALELGPTLLTRPTPSFVRYVVNWCDKWRRVLARLENSSSESAMVKRRQVTYRLQRVESWLARQHQQATGKPLGAQVDAGGDT